jgi:hypothetical protein
VAAEPHKPGSVQSTSTRRKRSAAELSYAYGTKVEVAASRAEIEGLLSRHGAKRIMASWDGETGDGWVLFQMGERYYRLDAPPREVGTRDPAQVYRERWRALLLITKARLEIVRSEGSTFEQEFLPYAMLADGKTTVRDQIEPALGEMYRTGVMGNLLPDFGAPRLPAGGGR